MAICRASGRGRRLEKPKTSLQFASCLQNDAPRTPRKKHKARGDRRFADAPRHASAAAHAGSRRRRGEHVSTRGGPAGDAGGRTQALPRTIPEAAPAER